MIHSYNPLVYYCLVPDIYAPSCTALSTLATDAERDRADRFVQSKDRSRYLQCRTILRAILSSYATGCDVSRDFIIDKHGKPRLSAGSLEFSLSHSGNALLVAISSVAVGADIERLRELDIVTLARSCLSPDERRWLDLQDTASQLEHFFCIWTAKEAILKSSGHGLRLDLREISVTPPKMHLTNLPRQLSSIDQWSIRSIPCPSGYCAALAVSAPSILVQEISFEELLHNRAATRLTG